MRGFLVLLLTVGMGFGFLLTVQAEDQAASLQLPSSLDSLYPPKAPQPIHLLRMLGLGSLFSGIASDVVENDLQGARASFEKFKTEYLEISKLVPEWKNGYPLAPVEEWGASLKLGDREKIMGAQGKVGEVCHDCHSRYMASAEQKYHWGNFSAITVKDPLSNETVPFARLKQYLDSNYAGISLNLERGQIEKARKQAEGFKARFQALKTTCGNCHTGEIKYYADEGVQGMIDKVGQSLERSSADPKPAVELVQRIGAESCFKCHLVHVPAAFSQMRDR